MAKYNKNLITIVAVVSIVALLAGIILPLAVAITN